MSDLLDRRLLFVTGKGGVGKTTVAAALALAAARRGKRTIVCEVSQQGRMPHAFGRAELGYAETELAPNLFAMSIDPNRALEEYLVDQTGSERLSGLLARNRLLDYFVAAAPGLRELVMIGKVWELAQPQRRISHRSPYDLVIVDAPATGHGLGLLRTPHTYREATRGPVRRQAGHIRDFLHDPARTAVIAVALAQEMPVVETIEFGAAAAELGIPVQAVVVNALLPERFSAEEARLLESLVTRDGAPRVAGALHAALSEYGRARAQRLQLRKLRRQMDRVVTLPYVWEAELGEAELGRLAEELERKVLV